ncbi:MAG: type ISP restriction/modification enzyme, partial [Hydrogenophaga sp.]|uniref:type ISP restriction/modification enzyme n=1 Tax=Hydrogenophaga sp. TaxID=1904254 RepID=UPI003D0F4419
MTEEQRQRLKAIKSFPQLIDYLRTELDWPIEEGHDEDDLTFDWSDDLGLKDSERVGIKEIKQLRPLETGQPWGIFFVNFEKKQLPIVILRRILNALVMKKRTSANKAQQAAWRQHDLLFISSYGEDTDRQLTFAHFSEPSSELDASKATLRVLGWDDEDTNLKLDYVANKLHEKLTWPQDTTNLEKWRQQWAAAFELRPRQVITTAEELALRLAELAKRIRNRMLLVLPRESEKGELRKLLKGFQTALIHDLDEKAFADMYAQTITYGLFSAAVSRTVPGAGTAVDQGNIVDMVPVTNPFLKEMLQSFLKAGGRKGKLDFDELGIQEVVDLLNNQNTHLDAVLRDFGNKRRDEDPVIHFYEDFLRAYDNQLRVRRGVFYTPQPVVSYIVRSVHELLQTEFGLEDGLADTTTWGEMLKMHPGLKLPPLTDEPGEKRTISPDEPFVQILDPATGTATFLVEVIDVIHRTMVAKWKKQGFNEATRGTAWNDYVPKHLLPRLHAFELMMAPYAIAHMKIGLKLQETGYRFGTEERARIYLTNALEPKVSQLPFIEFTALAHEAAAVNEIKWHKRFTVVIGNPPYSYMSANLNAAAAALIEPFRYVDGQRIRERSALSLERSLQDDFVKFFGLALRIRRDTGPAFILGFITNSSYMDSALHRGVRGELMCLLDRLYLVNLFGDSIKDREENVFEIQQGVAVFLGAKRTDESVSEVFVSNVHGTRSEKYAAMQSQSLKTSKLTKIHPTPPQRYFLRLESGGEYPGFPSLNEVFQLTSTCIKTLKDSLATGFDAKDVQSNVDYFRDARSTAEQIKARFGVEDVVQWKMEPARRAVRNLELKEFTVRYQARPFDYRWMFYHNAIVGSPRAEVMRNLLRTQNIALIANRKIRTGECHHFWVSSRICVSEIISSADNSNCFPLYVVADEHGLNLGDSFGPNFSQSFLNQLCATLAVTKTDKAGLPAGLTPEDIFHYIYAVFHSPGYRSRYAEFLKIDFPRLPLTGNLELFRALARLGGELVALHLLESPRLDQPITEFIGSNREVAK